MNSFWRARHTPTLVELREFVSVASPRLRQRVWPPMTYMLIPALLDATDRVIALLERGALPSREHGELLAELWRLRADFRHDVAPR